MNSFSRTPQDHRGDAAPASIPDFTPAPSDGLDEDVILNDEGVHEFLSSVYFFRTSYRWAKSYEERDQLFWTLCRDYERLREWCREHGMMPPKFEISKMEADWKPWLISPTFGEQMPLALESADVGQALLFPDPSAAQRQEAPAS